jgi:type II secretory pathway pseudopilin PulG
MKNNQKGRSMIEMLGVLAIIGVLSVGGIAGYSKAMAKFRANKMMDQVSHIVANIRILFGSQKTYKALATTEGKKATKLLVEARLVPDDLKTDIDATIKEYAMGEDLTASQPFTNPYSGNVVIKSSRLTAESDNRAFTIVYTNIPREACIDLAAQDWNSSSGSGLIAFGINADVEEKIYGNCTDTAAADGSAIICAERLPMNVSDALLACNKTVNKFYFKFH